jgi:hypothetical protein
MLTAAATGSNKPLKNVTVVKSYAALYAARVDKLFDLETLVFVPF